MPVMCATLQTVSLVAYTLSINAETLITKLLSLIVYLFLLQTRH